MMQNRWFRVAALALAVITAGAAGAGADEDVHGAHQLVQQARERWELQGDANGALRLFNQAVEAAPDDPVVRLARGNFLERVAQVARADQQAALKRAAREDYAAVAGASPDSVRAGVARDGIARLDGRQWFPASKIACSTDAIDAFAEAEKLFNSGRFGEALAFYATAAGGCPDNGMIWMSYADAFYASGEYEQAEATFRKALQIDPWDRAAHRFLSDTEGRLGHLDEGLRQAALAVASDPGYEAAWETLRSFSLGTGRSYLRVYGERATVSAGPVAAGGEQNVVIRLPSAGDELESQPDDTAAGGDAATGDAEREGTRANGDPQLWLAYGITKASLLVPGDAKLVGVELSPFEIERLAVESVLEDFTPADGAPFWSMLARAQAAGYLDEAIYLHLLDETLVPEYIQYRQTHASELVAYLLGVVAPLPTAGE